MENLDGYDLWLRYLPVRGAEKKYAAIRQAVVVGSGETLDSAHQELSRALGKLCERSVAVTRVTAGPVPQLAPGTVIAGTREALESAGCLDALALSGDQRKRLRRLPEDDGYALFSIEGKSQSIVIVADTGAGVLYGVFHLLRLLQTGMAVDGLDIAETPKTRLRMMNHWDNLDGSIERGYAGRTLWQWAELPGKVDPRYTDYARACASVGLNASVLNNVNTQPQILERAYLEKVAAIAAVLRRYGIKTFLSVNFGSPRAIGGLDTADPGDARVIAWWRAKADEIYGLIPDFGGFLVKADSEGQPGPFAYGKTHADGANLLADALAPHNGIVIWRAFVYGHGESDRAKKAYANFKPLDGQFRDNVAVQVKNGAIDFQPREPVHPLFGAMKRTPVFMEMQIAQEYLGQGNHLVYLAPMWKEILSFDMRSSGKGSTVGKIISTKRAPHGLSGIAAVTNTGDNRDWCGSLFHPANWFAFGRLAWDWTLDTTSIAQEWTAMTWGDDMRVREAVLTILTKSWDACVDYMTPLCLHHIMKEGHHYGPDPADNAPAREDWRPTYYHRASHTGIGFDRTATGTDAVSQYSKPVAKLFGNLKTCPEKYLLWFHHVPWEHVLSNGRTVKDEIVARYAQGVAEAEALRAEWKKVEGAVEAERYQAVLAKLDIQVADAHEWQSVCVEYFLSFTRYRDLFSEYGYDKAETDRLIDDAWKRIFGEDGGPSDPRDPACERFYFDSGDDMGYMLDTGNYDARTEGMSYGMMMAVQMDRKDVFDRIWRWTVKNMYLTEGPNAGYFGWSVKPDGSAKANGPAPDGEEYFALALFFASHRWGDGTGTLDYDAWARKILSACVHKGVDGKGPLAAGQPMWDPETALIKFVPGLDFSDPSYHLPHFYDLFAQWANPEDRDFWRRAAEASRQYLPIACHPTTGLAPEYADYDGKPRAWNGPHDVFFSDSYRVAANLGLEASWSGSSLRLGTIARNVIAFFDGKKPTEYMTYRIDGTPIEPPALHPTAIIATNAMGALAVRPDAGEEAMAAAKRAVALFRQTPLRTGERRYYDNCLYFFSLLALAGRYRVW